MNISGEVLRDRAPFLALLLFFCATAQADGGMTLKVMVEQEVTVSSQDGKQQVKRVPATKIVPGDEVIYTIHYLNGAAQPAEDIFITIPVAEHTTYRSGSARGADTEITFSVDGGKNYGKPDELTIALDDGRTRPASAADYTHIRWSFSIPVAPGASGAVSYRAVLN